MTAKLTIQTFGELQELPDAAALKAHLAERMRAQDENCGLCMKPFNSVRRPAGLVGFNHHNDAGTVLSEYLLCRRCLREYRKHGQAALAAIQSDARDAARCLLTPAQGGMQ